MSPISEVTKIRQTIEKATDLGDMKTQRQQHQHGPCMNRGQPRTTQRRTVEVEINQLGWRSWKMAENASRYRTNGGR